MKTFTIALAAAASLWGATFLTTEASAAPGFRGHGGFGHGVSGGGFRPGGFRPAGVRPGAIRPGVIRPGAGWRHPGHGHWGHGRGHGRGWGYAAVGFAGAAYFARPLYTSAYSECQWVRVRTEFGPRWRPYC
jgi:hypothetical protein